MLMISSVIFAFLTRKKPLTHQVIADVFLRSSLKNAWKSAEKILLIIRNFIF